MITVPIDWLLASEPWTAYRTRLDLLGEPEDSTNVQLARAAMIADPMVRQIMQHLTTWPCVMPQGLLTL